MKNQGEDSAPLSADEAAFVERLAEHYAPPPLDPMRRVALDAELEERLEAPRAGSLLQPVLASVVVGLALGFVWLLGALEPAALGPVRTRTAVAERSAADAWERELLDLQSFGDGEAAADFDALPDDYAAIAGLFLDG